MLLRLFEKALIILAVLHEAADAARCGAIRGAVVDQFGVPIAGARVMVGVRPIGADREVKADSFGRFALDELSSGPKRLTAMAAGFRTESVDVVLAPNRDVHVNIGLTVAAVADSQKRTIVVEVTDAEGRPVSLALLYLRSPWIPRFTRHVTTDKSGRFKFVIEEIGQYELHARAPGGRSGTVIFEVGPGPEDRRVEIVLRSFDPSP